MPESFIEKGDGHTTFVGPDATALFAATSLCLAIKFYRQTSMKVNRTYTPANMLAAAGRYTGKTYKRSQLRQAEDDLRQWIEAMKAAIPVK